MATEKNNKEKLSACPYCSYPFSPWQEVLLDVDRELICKKCWKKILLDASDEVIIPNSKDIEKPGRKIGPQKE